MRRRCRCTTTSRSPKYRPRALRVQDVTRCVRLGRGPHADVVRRSDDDDVAYHGCRRTGPDGTDHVDPVPRAVPRHEIDDTVLAEALDGVAGLGVERCHVVTRGNHHDTPVARCVLPIRYAAAGVRPGRVPHAVFFVHAPGPERLAGARVDRDDRARHAGGRVQDPVDHQRGRFRLGERVRPVVAPVPAPHDLEVRDVGRVDLIEGRVVRVGSVVPVCAPLAGVLGG